MSPRIRKNIILVASIIILSSLLSFPNVNAAEKITIGYFPAWPQGFQVLWPDKGYEKRLGIDIDWREFDSGGQMITALASGDLKIAYGLGLMGTAIAMTKGLPLKLIGMVQEADAIDTFAARDGSGIISPADLRGKKVAVAFSSNSHYKIMGVFKVFGIKETDLTLLDMQPQDIVAAFIRGDIDAGFTWEPHLTEMLKTGHKILDGREIGRWGYSAFDVVLVTDSFAAKNRDLIVKFLGVVEEAVQLYYQDPERAYVPIAKAAGITPELTKTIISKCHPWTAEEQLSPEWMGPPGKPGRLAGMLKRVSEFLVTEAIFNKALDDYRNFIDSSYLQAVVN